MAEIQWVWDHNAMSEPLINILVGSHGHVQPRFWFKDKRVEGGGHQAWSPGEWYDFIRFNMYKWTCSIIGFLFHDIDIFICFIYLVDLIKSYIAQLRYFLENELAWNHQKRQNLHVPQGTAYRHGSNFVVFYILLVGLTSHQGDNCFGSGMRSICERALVAMRAPLQEGKSSSDVRPQECRANSACKKTLNRPLGVSNYIIISFYCRGNQCPQIGRQFGSCLLE